MPARSSSDISASYCPRVKRRPRPTHCPTASDCPPSTARAQVKKSAWSMPRWRKSKPERSPPLCLTSSTSRAGSGCPIAPSRFTSACVKFSTAHSNRRWSTNSHTHASARTASATAPAMRICQPNATQSASVTAPATAPDISDCSAGTATSLATDAARAGSE